MAIENLSRNTRTSGIYRITCLPTSKIYIGSSIDVYKRICTHKFQLRRNKHPNQYLQRAWNKYLEDSFKFELIEETSDILSREAFWFKETNCCNEEFGFNLCEKPSAGITKTGPEHFNYGRKHVGKKLQNIIDAIKNRPDGWQEKISLANTGKKRTIEQNKNRSLKSKKRKLTTEQVAEIRELCKIMRPRDVHKLFPIVSRGTISNIKHNRTNRLI